MGIKNLSKFLESKAPSVFRPIHISNYAYKKIAVDVSIFLYKYKVINPDKWIQSFISLIATLRDAEVHPIFIFEGKCPEEKNREREKRKEENRKNRELLDNVIKDYNEYKITREATPLLYNICEKRNKAPLLLPSSNKKTINTKLIDDEIRILMTRVTSITNDDITLVKELLNILGVPYIDGDDEGERIASKLCCTGKVDAVLSEDTDILAYGTPKFITKLNTSSGMCLEIDINNILSELDLTQSQFTDFCIMCGTDYNSNIFKVGPVKAYDLITETGSIEGVKEKYGEKYDITILNHKRGRELFSISDIPFHLKFCKKPDREKFSQFLFKNNIRGMDNILKKFEPKELVFE